MFENRLLLELVLGGTDRFRLLLLLLLEDLRQVRLALERLVRWAFVALLHRSHPCVAHGTAVLVEQLRLAHSRPVVVSPLHCLHNLIVQFGPAACIDWGNLLVADKHRLSVNALAEADSVLARAHAVMRCLCAHPAEKILTSVALCLCTLISHAVALALALALREVARFEHLAAVGGLGDLGSALRRLVQVNESLIDSFGILVSLGLEDLGAALKSAA